MTTFFPDISGYQTGIRLDGIPAVMVKATEGTGYVNPDYARVVADARARGLLQMAYHFLRRGNGAGQADYAYGVIGPGVPTMVDVEPAGDGTAPSLADVSAFVSEFRARGGLVRLVYLPRWFWVDLGSPDLTGLTRANLALISSTYTTYSDSGSGWAPYGGVTPAIWQFSESYPLNGYAVDMNAYRGSLDDLRALVTGDDMDLNQVGGIVPGISNAQVLKDIWVWLALIASNDKGPRSDDRFAFGNPLYALENRLGTDVAAQLGPLGSDLAALKGAVASAAGPVTDAQVAAIGAQVAAVVVAHHDALTVDDEGVIQAAAEAAVREVLGALDGATPPAAPPATG